MIVSDADPNTPSLTPIYITVDPERDTVEAMKAYVEGMTSSVM